MATLQAFRRVLASVAIILGWAGCATVVQAGDPEDPARLRRALGYLDARQAEWSQFSKAERGEGATKTACVSCHTGLSYALARPALRPFAISPGPAVAERRMSSAINLRVGHRAELDSPQFELMYDFDDRKKVESRGTEAVLNALILARDDAAEGRPTPGPATRSALRHLWETQTTEGSDAGSWEWLNFGLQPWEGQGSRGFGAALAALAVGSAPRYLDQELDESASRGIRLLRDYLRRRFPEENLFNRLWMVEASKSFEELLTTDQRREVIDQILKIQREDGGWSLADLGTFQRVDKSTQVRESDGYATGFVLHVLLQTGTVPSRPEVARGLAWLRSHQQADGSWLGRSVNKERDPKTFVGKLMSDAATAMAALAIVEAGARE